MVGYSEHYDLLNFRQMKAFDDLSKVCNEYRIAGDLEGCRNLLPNQNDHLK